MQIAKSYKIIDGIIKLYDANGKEIYGRVHLEGDFSCDNNQLTSLAIPEGFTCGGYFSCDNNQLTSLAIPEGFTCGRGFYCSYNNLTSLVIPEGFTCGGDFSCSSNQLTSLVIPEGFTCGRDFYCDNNQLTSLVVPEGVTCGGNFYCSYNNLTSLVIPEGFTCGRGFYCSYNQLTSLAIPEGFTCGGNFSCGNNQLTSLVIPEGFTCGGYFSCSSNQLTSLVVPEGFTCGRDFYCDSNQLTGFQSPTPATFNDFFKKGFLFADGVLTKIIHKKGDVYKTQKIGSEKIVYVVKDGDVFSHGKTVKAAKLDLAFKKSDRNIDDFKGMSLDTAKDPEEWALIYRIITGACSIGTEMFIASKGKLKKKYTLEEILEETKGAYGSERFKQVVMGE